MRLRPFRFLLFPPLVATETERLRTFLFFFFLSLLLLTLVLPRLPLYLYSFFERCSYASAVLHVVLGLAKRSALHFRNGFHPLLLLPPPPLQVLLPSTKASFAVSRERSSLDPTNHLSSWRCTTSSNCGWVKQKLRTFVAFRQ